MCSGGGGSAPTPPPPVPEAPRLPDPRASETVDRRDVRRRAGAAGESSRSTILTGPRGVQNGAGTVVKTLLGQ